MLLQISCVVFLWKGGREQASNPACGVRWGVFRRPARRVAASLDFYRPTIWTSDRFERLGERQGLFLGHRLPLQLCRHYGRLNPK